MNPAISIITPSLNQADFIERTIDSVLSQGVAGLEYMIVDGGSSDGTLDLLKQCQDTVRWVSEPDHGQAAAVNRGLESTSGAVIGWLNSDDIYYPGALQSVVSYFRDNPNADILYGDANHIAPDDDILGPYPTEDWDYQRLIQTCYLCQPAVFFRRRVVERFGLLDIRWHYALDYEFWLRLGKHLDFVRIPHLLAGSRVHESTKTFGSPVQAHREYLRMFQDVLGQVPDRWVFNYAHALVNEKQIDRGQPGGRVRYILWLLLLSTGNFLRWNQRVPASARRTMREWIGKPLAGAVKELWKR